MNVIIEIIFLLSLFDLQIIRFLIFSQIWPSRRLRLKWIVLLTNFPNMKYFSVTIRCKHPLGTYSRQTVYDYLRRCLMALSKSNLKKNTRRPSKIVENIHIKSEAILGPYVHKVFFNCQYLTTVFLSLKFNSNSILKA